MEGVSTELFFNEAEFRIIVPNNPKQEQADPVSIVEAPVREFAFYGSLWDINQKDKVYI